MRGHEHIIAMRMAGRAPEWVVIDDYPTSTDWHVYGDMPTVCTNGDAIARLDLRFLVELKVSIASTEETRAKALFEATKDAGARLIGACHVQTNKHPHAQDGWACVWEKPIQAKEASHGQFHSGLNGFQNLPA